MKHIHMVNFSDSERSANLELCVFCERLKDINKPEACIHFEDDYEDVSCPGFIKVQDVSSRLMEALDARSKMHDEKYP